MPGIYIIIGPCKLINRNVWRNSNIFLEHSYNYFFFTSIFIHRSTVDASATQFALDYETVH